VFEIPSQSAVSKINTQLTSFGQFSFICICYIKTRKYK